MARKLLKAAALTAGTMLSGCGSAITDTEPIGMPGNPKGSHYDDAATDGVDETDGEVDEDEAKPDDAKPDDEAKVDEDKPVEDNKPVEDAKKPPPPPPPLEATKIEPKTRPGNPKGSRYDDKAILETNK